MEQPLVSIVVITYNSAKTVIETLDSAKNQTYKNIEVVLIDDGSKDNTLEICKEKGYNYIDMPINVGLAGGVQTGMMYAYENGYEYALQFDGDGQHDPAYIASMLEAMPECDICIGSRFVTEKKPMSLRMFGSNIIQLLLKITTGKTIKDPTSGMRMFNRATMKPMAELPDYGPEPDTLAHLIHSGAVIKSVQVQMRERIAGESYLNLARSIRYIMHMCMSIMVIQWFRKKVNLKGGASK